MSERFTPREKLAFTFVAIVGGWLCASLGVFSQEAYYWGYAQHPALSYFDHPPMVAWLIWVGTHLFGDGAIGIRVGTWLAGCGITLVGMWLLREMGVGERGRIAWAILSIGVPALTMTHFLAGPDAPLVFFWALSLAALWRARDGGLGVWAFAGAAAGCALLSKYTAAFLAVSGVLVLLLDPKLRRQLLRPGPWVGVLTAALVFSPVVLWNAQHDFASFRYQTAERIERGAFGIRWFLQCVVGQIGIANPVLIALLPLVLAWLWRRARRRDPRAVWLLAFGVPLPAYLIADSLWMQVKVNWFAPAYVPLVLGGVLWWCESGWPELHTRWRRAVRISLVVVFAAAPLAPLIAFVPSGGSTTWTGWDDVAKAAAKQEAQLASEDVLAPFVFTTDYKDSAQLVRAWHASRSGDAMRDVPVLAQNVIGRRAMQFDYWTDPEAHLGQDAIFVLRDVDRADQRLHKVSEFFHTIRPVDRVVVSRLGIEVMKAELFVCRGYLGPEPPARGN